MTLDDQEAFEVFVAALKALLREKGEKEEDENEGVVVSYKGHKYGVINLRGEMQIINFDDEDIEPGTMLWFHDDEVEDLEE